MVEISPNRSITRVHININILNLPTKRQRFSEGFLKIQPGTAYKRHT